MKKGLFFFVFCTAMVLALLVQSCEEESFVVSQADSYVALLSKYEAGASFMKADKTSEGTTVFFDGAGSVVIGASDFTVSNCCFKDPLDLELDDAKAEWILDGKPTGIEYTPERTLQKSIPVYACFTEKSFRVYASNGESFCFYCDVDNPLLSFSFRRQFNPELDNDIQMVIEGRNVSGVTHLTSETLEMVPTFDVDADYVTVNGERQISSSSSQDFSTPVKYVVHKYNGKTEEYTVYFDFLKQLPSVRIETDGGKEITSKYLYVTGSIVFEDYDRIYSQVQRVEAGASFKGRGNTTWSMFPEKRPYRIKLDESMPVFGIHKDRDWVLLAEYSDKTLLRNRVAMEISKICELDWTPQMRSVTLYINGVYRGVYTLSEHKEVSSHKVDIDIVKESDNSSESLTGGYYLEIDTSKDQPVCFDTNIGIPIMFIEPENPTNAQKNYVIKYLNDFETALYSDSFGDPKTGYAKYIDVDSFINYYIIAELSKNIDGNLAKSCFLSKPESEKLRFCHTWDYDLAFGNCNYIKTSYEGAANGPEGWFACKYIIGDYYTRESSPGWFGRLLEDPVYLAAFKKRWDELYPELKKIPSIIDSFVDNLYGAQDDNFQVHKILGKQVWPNRFVYNTYEEEVLYLKTYYSQRLEWMNKAIHEL